MSSKEKRGVMEEPDLSTGSCCVIPASLGLGFPDDGIKGAGTASRVL